MDLATIIGLILGFGAIVLAGWWGGTPAGIIFGRPEAIILIIGGTLGATLTSFPMRTFIRGFFGGFRSAFVQVDYHERDVISTLVSFAEKARREGLLALENEAAALDDDFMRKGIQLVIDGRDTEIIRKVLETEVSSAQELGAKSEQVFMNLGGYSPTLGIIGTVLGLIGMLQGLGSNSPDMMKTIGQNTASAFVATFFGIMLANLAWLPIATKIKERNGQLLLMREIMIEGILAIQAGDNPRLLEEKLLAFVDPKERETDIEEGGAIAGEHGYSASSA
ncbi:MAG TPA: motility protein A [Candidatus Acidoferrales bacterium]|nr:motility protein A [Candidatus Acidoferrales bacterium]